MILDQVTNLPSLININSKLGVWEQVIDFESIHFACFHCKKVGHWEKKCPLKPKVPFQNVLDPSQKDSVPAKVWKEIGKCSDSRDVLSLVEPLVEEVSDG